MNKKLIKISKIEWKNIIQINKTYQLKNLRMKNVTNSYLLGRP